MTMIWMTRNSLTLRTTKLLISLPRHPLRPDFPHVDSLGRPIGPLHQLYSIKLGNLISKASALYLSYPS